jgi:N-acetylated-alpha-linked acidic dipeptidase
VERGSVLYDFIYPGVASDNSNMPHIPVLPLSYADARHILEHLTGGAAPHEWQGGLPFTYRLGPGRSKVHMKVHVRSQRRTIWNVVAKLRGSEEPEQIVVVGNHRDAWVYGAVDPISGTVAMLEMARGLGVMLKEGWRPRRSIWLCSWDAEEPDEFGSTSWAEQHAVDLTGKAVAYLNLDAAVGGDHFAVSATPSLKEFLREVAADVPDPRGGSILERANGQLREQLRRELSSESKLASSAQSSREPIAQRVIEIGNLGGGTDYAVFFDHMGIPSVDFDFEGSYGVYHSAFDDYRWMKEFGDPRFVYHVAAARFFGIEALRLADADLLPFDYELYGQEIQSCLSAIRKQALLLSLPDGLDLRPAQVAAERLAQAGKRLRGKYESALALQSEPPALVGINRALVDAERAFLSLEGLPGRPWFKHVVFAPGFHNGYGSVCLPGVQESIDAGKVDQAQRQLQILTNSLNHAVELLTRFGDSN